MKRILFTILFSFLLLWVGAVKPYYRIGQTNKSVHDLTAEVTKLLLGHDFDVLGMYHPNDDENLCVIIFSCDELTSMATTVTDKGAFGAALKIGLIGRGSVTDITMLNPHFIKHAYFNTGANGYEAMKMTAMTDSLVKDALSPISYASAYYGTDIPIEELYEYHFLPTMPRYSDVVELNEYEEYLEGVATVKSNLLKHADDCELVYELAFDDKEIAIFGVAFHGKNNPDKEMLELMGVDCISSMPIEILVQGHKAYILNGKYRIPLFKSDISRLKLFKIMGIASDIRACMQNVSEWDEED